METADTTDDHQLTNGNNSLAVSVGKRWLFLISVTFITVFYSEKMYWYVQGYEYLRLVLFYMFGPFVVLWAISYFRIKHFWAFVLAGVFYPLYVEGYFTGIITADNGVGMLSYFVGWHTTLGFILGFYFHRKWLINGSQRVLIVSSVLIGIFWGLWSTVYWSQMNINDPELQEFYKLGQWPVEEFVLLAIYLTTIYIASHYVLSRLKLWRSSYKPSPLAWILILAWYTLLFYGQYASFGIISIKLLVFTILIFGPLILYRRQRLKEEDSEQTIFVELEGQVKLIDLLSLYIMPIFAVLTYWVFLQIKPTDEFLDNILFLGTFIVQAGYGLILMIVGLVWTLMFSLRNKPN